MATTTGVSLTGEDLTLADVWAVAVDGTKASLSGDARAKLQAARFVEQRLAAVALLRLDDAGNALDVADHVDSHASSLRLTSRPA